ncbi:MAG: response regulator, partial [Gemmatimonadetes bacterium]|nr:response regulator [Gemmatimonadota bacterium]
HMKRFDTSVLEGASATELRQVQEPAVEAVLAAVAADAEDRFSLWGCRDGPRNRRVWSTLRPGSRVAFISRSRWLATARVTATFESAALGQSLWGGGRGKGWSLIVALEDVTTRDQSASDLAHRLGQERVPRRITAWSVKDAEALILEAPDSAATPEDQAAVKEASGRTIQDPVDRGAGPRARERPQSQTGSEPDPGLPVPDPQLLFDDEMTRWYRQGLMGRFAALRAARQSLDKGEPGARESILRVARALAGPQIEVRFPSVGQLAREVLDAADVEFMTATNQLLGALDETMEVRDPEPVKIMVVEDDPVQALLVREIVSGPNRQVFQADSVEIADEVLAEHEVSLIILDLGMPGADGRDLLTRLRESHRTSGTPILMLSGKTGVQPKTECLALGADGFYDKPVAPATLAAAVAGLLERSAEARYLARRDALTGLPNRSLFLESAERTRLAALRRGDDLTMILLSLDEAADLSERWGAAARDRVFKLLATTLQYTIRRTDLITRWGSNEFALLLAGVGPSQAGNFVNKILDAVSAITVPETPEVRISCSIGSASIEPGDGVEDGAALAAHRLRVAKRGGGGVSVSDQQEVLPTMRQVVLVEDDDIAADLVVHRLERAGYRVKRFGNGGEALESIEGTLPTVVILDTTLPGASGFEILHRLRLNPQFEDVPVFMLTSGDPAEATRALEFGANDALSKPFDSGEFMARVESLV